MENIRKDHWGNRFSTRLRGALVLETLGPGRHQIEAEVGYSTGESFKKTFLIDVAATPQPGDTWADQHGAFIIAGPGLQGPRLPLASTARRGDNRLQLAPNHGLKPGDHIMIEAPATDRWNKLTGNVTLGGRIASTITKSLPWPGLPLPSPIRCASNSRGRTAPTCNASAL